MPEIKLFSLNGNVSELTAKSVLLEKELQNLIEKNMQTFFESLFYKVSLKLQMGEWTV